MPLNGARDKELTIGQLKVKVRELTVGEIGEWLNDKLKPSPDLVADPLCALLPVGDMLLGDVLRMTDLDRDSVKGLTGSDLEQLSDLCREVNKSFFALAATLTLAGSAALNQHLEA